MLCVLLLTCRKLFQSAESAPEIPFVSPLCTCQTFCVQLQLLKQLSLVERQMLPGIG